MNEVLMDVLRMPYHLFWAEYPPTRLQHDRIRLEAADEIKRLREALRRAQADICANLCAHDANSEPHCLACKEAARALKEADDG